MVATEDAPGRGAKTLRKLRARRSGVEERREDTGRRATRERGRVTRRVKAFGEEPVEDGLLVQGREAGPVVDARVGIVGRVDRRIAQGAVANGKRFRWRFAR